MNNVLIPDSPVAWDNFHPVLGETYRPGRPLSREEYLEIQQENMSTAISTLALPIEFQHLRPALEHLHRFYTTMLEAALFPDRAEEIRERNNILEADMQWFRRHVAATWGSDFRSPAVKAADLHGFCA